LHLAAAVDKACSSDTRQQQQHPAGWLISEGAPATCRQQLALHDWLAATNHKLLDVLSAEGATLEAIDLVF
jgi:hypothetical protein